MEQEALELKRKRKLEAKKLKQQRIAEAGGKRPRVSNPAIERSDEPASSKTTTTSPLLKRSNDIAASKVKSKKNTPSKHRFGKVMETVPCPKKSRYSTLSIAVPGSILTNCATKELQTLMVGQIARAATIFHVDEIVVYDDHLGKTANNSFYSKNKRQTFKKRFEKSNDDEEDTSKKKPRTTNYGPVSAEDAEAFMARLLQYCECPQYLRRALFEMHSDLQYTGLLPPLDAPHHVRVGEDSLYREGVVLAKIYKDGSGIAGAKSMTEENNAQEQQPWLGPNGLSMVNIGISGRPVEVDRVLPVGVRCTVKLDPSVYKSNSKNIKGTVVSPAAPRENDGSYWGYTTRIASSISAVFEDCPFSDDGSYDLKIGTSERGNITVDDKEFSLPQFKHSIIVFGGVSGIEECVDADESLSLPGRESHKLFDMWVNTCPFQGSRTIRTEEAVLATLARMRPFINENPQKAPSDRSSRSESSDEDNDASIPEDVEFSDEASSEEE